MFLRGGVPERRRKRREGQEARWSGSEIIHISAKSKPELMIYFCQEACFFVNQRINESLKNAIQCKNDGRFYYRVRFLFCFLAIVCRGGLGTFKRCIKVCIVMSLCASVSTTSPLHPNQKAHSVNKPNVSVLTYPSSERGGEVC